jgi:spore germination cell wall hydrolase CwlJ-like protein
MRLLSARYSRYLFGVALCLVAGALIWTQLDVRPGLARTTGTAHLATIHIAPAAPPAQVPLAAAPQSFEALSPEQAVAANALAPVSKAPNPPARPFAIASASPADRAAALSCLTSAVYYEAANQGPDGEAAVAQVVLNRVRSPIFPKTVCGVVFEGSELKTGCQFTFTCDGSLARRPSAALWRGARQFAERALNGYVQKSVGLATHYHTVWVVPYWRSSVDKVGQIGAHIFYRMQGGLGAAGGFAGLYAGAELTPAVLKTIDPDATPAPPVELAATPKPQIASAEPAARILPQPPAAIEVAVKATPVAIAALPANFDAPKPAGFFGRQGAAQRLPIATRY